MGRKLFQLPTQELQHPIACLTASGNLTSVRRCVCMRSMRLAVMSTPHRLSCRIYLGKDSIKGRLRAFICRQHTILQGASRSRILDMWMHMCFCGSGAHCRYRAAGWPQTVSTLTGVVTTSIAFFLLSTSSVRQRPRRRPPRVPLRASYFSRLQLLRIKLPVPRSRCFISPVSTGFS